MLTIEGVSKNFGGITALNDIYLNVNIGSIMGIIGPNGAGKTTLFNVISGLFKPLKGKIFFYGEEITCLRAFEIARRGVARTFQIIRLFPLMTVLENVLVGQNKNTPSGLLSLFRSLRNRQESCLKNEALSILDFMGLSHFQNNLAAELSYGEQRRLELARALACGPRLLLLDEPTSGMTYQESMEVVDRIRLIRERGCTVLIIEHDMNVVKNVCDIVAVLNFGSKIMEGSCDQVQRNPEVIEAYLGEEYGR